MVVGDSVIWHLPSLREQQLVQQRFAAKTTGTMFISSDSSDPKISLEQRLSGQAK